MEELFKQNLLRMHRPFGPKTFSEALFPHALWRPKVAVSGRPPVQHKEGYSEKRQVIESLERYVEEKVKEEAQASLKLPGAELALKTSNWHEVEFYDDLTSLKKVLSFESEVLDIVFKGKIPGTTKVLFITETYRPFAEAGAELKQGLINELLMAFPFKTAELFHRMINAMKLTSEEVLIYPVEHLDKEITAEAMAVAAFFRPEIIVTLGARATQRILKSIDRLSLIHGQFFSRSLDERASFQVVPLFHPSIIETNQNMKKTAWADMQKIMKHLKKLT